LTVSLGLCSDSEGCPCKTKESKNFKTIRIFFFFLNYSVSARERNNRRGDVLCLFLKDGVLLIAIKILSISSHISSGIKNIV